MDCRMEAMVEAKVIGSLAKPFGKAAEGESFPVYQVAERIVRLVVAQPAVNDVIHVKVNNLAQLLHFVQHLTSKPIKIHHVQYLSPIC